MQTAREGKISDAMKIVAADEKYFADGFGGSVRHGDNRRACGLPDCNFFHGQGSGQRGVLCLRHSVFNLDDLRRNSCGARRQTF